LSPWGESHRQAVYRAIFIRAPPGLDPNLRPNEQRLIVSPAGVKRFTALVAAACDALPIKRIAGKEDRTIFWGFLGL
jgi:hypothetical protein